MSSERFDSSPEPARAGRSLRWLAGSPLRTVLGCVVLLASLAVPPSACAHLRSGTVAVDFGATVFQSRTAAYSAQIFQSDRALGLTIKRGHTVVLVGYLGEPVFRLDAAGLWVNATSPTAVVLRLISRSSRAVAATPQWRLTRGRHSIVWQDARAQGLPSSVRRGDWSVPLIVDGRRSLLRGELQRFPAPALWPWLCLLTVLLAGGAAPLLLRRRGLAGAAATRFAVAASAAAIVILAGFALDAYASPGTWIEGVDAVAFLGVAIWVLFRGPERWRVAGAVGAGLVALAVGLLEGAVFAHPIVLAILPAVAVRLACVVAIGAGIDAAALGALFYAETDAPGAGAPAEQKVPVRGSALPVRAEQDGAAGPRGISRRYRAG
jgi:hypothetical protein